MAPESGSVNSVTELSQAEKLAELQKLGFTLRHQDHTETQLTELVNLLYDFQSAFAQDVSKLPEVSDIEYKINLKEGTIPKRQRQYKYPPHLTAEIRKQLQDWHKAGIVEKGDAEWFHPIVLVRKKPLDPKSKEPSKYRICLDLRSINDAMKLESYPMPTFSEIVETFGHPRHLISHPWTASADFCRSKWLRNPPDS